MTTTAEAVMPARRPPAGRPEDPRTDPSARWRDTWTLLNRRRGLAALVLAGATALGTVVALIIPPVFTAQSSFFPESKSGNELGSALGALGGIIGSGVSLGQPAPFFMDLLKSQSFLDSLAVSTITTDSVGTRRRVEEYLIEDAKTPQYRRWDARQEISNMIRVKQTPAGIVVVTVRDQSPYAAAAMANRAVNIVDELNIDFRRRQAVARRSFNQEFLNDVRSRRDTAERRLEDFLLANRVIETSPVLKQRYTRLNDDVSHLRALQEQVESTVESARLTEYNNAPVVTRVDLASVPERKSGPRRKLIVLGSLMLGGLVLFWWAYWRTGRRIPG
jgi:uncharacterized protein involved in exopolysaccharide biosynthesis